MIRTDGAPTIAWANDAPSDHVALLVCLRDWFANEVDAGDELLQVWVDRIDAALSSC